MKRLALATSLLAALALSPDASARGELDTASGLLRLPRDASALRTYDFEAADGLAGVEQVIWQKSGRPQLQRAPLTAADVASMLTTGDDDVLEGSHSLRLQGGVGLALVDATLFAQVGAGRFEVTLWARADGAAPQISVLYDRDPENIVGFGQQFASVRAVRTGRETSDGWAEYGTGALDGQVWGVPVRGIVVIPSYYTEADQSFLLDALEVRKIDGATVPLAECNAQTVDAACGAQGDCMFGHCVPASVTWGALPSPRHRSEIAERWIQFATRVIGDRNAAQHGRDLLEPAARELAATAPSSRQFFGGMNRLVNLLRDNHTSFGSPANFTNFAPQVESGSSSILGACFGVMEKDLLGGGLGYGVFRATESPATGVPLKRGDVIFAIDGRDPKEWVDDVWPRVATALPNDPASDWAPSANSLSRLITTRASNVTVVRCAPGTDCTGAARESFTIDVAKTAFQAVSGDLPPSVSPAFGCTQRFTESVVATPPANDGEDPVLTMAGPLGETRVQFDGFVGQTSWQASMRAVFTSHPARVIMDARMGHGGYSNAVQDLLDLLRGTDEPVGVVSLGRATYDLVDPPWLFERLGTCSTPSADTWSCFQGGASGFFTSKTSPPGGATRIAWLDTYDVSANDYMPRLLKGRTGFTIFGPHATSGAFGAISTLPPMFTGWSSGSLQVQDSHFGADLTSASTARWESGHGVEPDVVVTETMSDALGGVDTILEAASQWLASVSP